MQISQLLNEISTPTGAIFIRFKEKVGAVSVSYTHLTLPTILRV